MEDNSIARFYKKEECVSITQNGSLQRLRGVCGRKQPKPFGEGMEEDGGCWIQPGMGLRDFRLIRMRLTSSCSRSANRFPTFSPFSHSCFLSRRPNLASIRGRRTAAVDELGGVPTHSPCRSLRWLHQASRAGSSLLEHAQAVQARQMHDKCPSHWARARRKSLALAREPLGGAF